LLFLFRGKCNWVLGNAPRFWLDGLDFGVNGGIGWVNSHAASRVRASYRQQLSEKRSMAVKQFIITEKGIPSDRIITHGYGESMLLNECDDVHPCSEAKHGENRRCEIRVVRLGE
jgi:hypothetical protein